MDNYVSSLHKTSVSMRKFKLYFDTSTQGICQHKIRSNTNTLFFTSIVVAAKTSLNVTEWEWSVAEILPVYSDNGKESEWIGYVIDIYLVSYWFGILEQWICSLGNFSLTTYYSRLTWALLLACWVYQRVCHSWRAWEHSEQTRPQWTCIWRQHAENRDKNLRNVHLFCQ